MPIFVHNCCPAERPDYVLSGIEKELLCGAVIDLALNDRRLMCNDKRTGNLFRRRAVSVGKHSGCRRTGGVRRQQEPLILCLVLLILLLAGLIHLNFSALIWERRIYKATTDIRKLLSELPGKTERPSEDIRPGFFSEIQGSGGTDSEDSDGSGGSRTNPVQVGRTEYRLLLAAGIPGFGEIQGEKDSGKKIQKAEGSRSDAPDTLPEPTVHDPSPYVLTPAQPHRVDGLIVNSAVYYNLSKEFSSIGATPAGNRSICFLTIRFYRHRTVFRYPAQPPIIRIRIFTVFLILLPQAARLRH